MGKSFGKTLECSLKRHPTDIFCLLRSTDSNSRVFTSKHSFPCGLFQASCQSSFTSSLVFFSLACSEAFDYFWLQVILWVVYHPPGAPAWYQRRCPPVQYFFLLLKCISRIFELYFFDSNPAWYQHCCPSCNTSLLFLAINEFVPSRYFPTQQPFDDFTTSNSSDRVTLEEKERMHTYCDL